MASRRRRLAGGLIALALVSGPAVAEISSSREGELMTLLLHDCGACHGLTLKGGLGPPLRPAQIAWKSDEALADVILHGVPGTPMPPWDFEIGPDEAVWLAQMLKRGLPNEN